MREDLRILTQVPKNLGKGVGGNSEPTIRDAFEEIDGILADGGGGGEDGEDGASAFEIAVENGFEGDESEWLDSLEGEQGPPGNDGDPGDTGPEGLSAYDVAVEQGFEGDEEEWLESLQGEQGDPGEDGDDGSNDPSDIEVDIDGLEASNVQEALEELYGMISDGGDED